MLGPVVDRRGVSQPKYHVRTCCQVPEGDDCQVLAHLFYLCVLVSLGLPSSFR